MELYTLLCEGKGNTIMFLYKSIKNAINLIRDNDTVSILDKAMKVLNMNAVGR